MLENLAEWEMTGVTDLQGDLAMMLEMFKRESEETQGSQECQA